MGTTLTGKKVQNTYDSLLKLSDNDNLTSTAKIVGDGLGNNSPIYLSTSKVGINVTPTFEFQTNSHAKIGGDLTVGGNFTVNGTTTIVDSTVIAIGDNMMEMAKDNSSNTMDIGWYGTINSSGEKYVGVFYDASSGVATPEFHIGLGTVEPSSTAAWTVKGKLVIGALDATTGVFSGQVTIPATPVASTDAASKGYVDAQITAQDLDIAGDSGTGAVDLDSQTFTISGGTNVTTSVSGQTVTINATGAVDGSGTANDVVMWQDSNTLTDAPIAISGNNATFAGTVTSNNYMSVEGSSSGAYIRFKHSTGGLNYVGSSESLTGGFGDENDMLNYSVSGKWGVYTNSALALTIDESQNATFAGSVTANSLTIDDITIDGSTISDSSALTISSGDDITIDADSDINLDANGADIRFKDNGTAFVEFNSSTGTTFAGSVTVDALELDYNTSYYNQDKTISAYSASNYVYVNGTGGTDGLGLRLMSKGAATNVIGLENSNNSIFFNTNSTLALTIDNSQNSTFAGNVTLSSTGAATFSIENTNASQTWGQYVGSNDDYVFRDFTDSRSTLILHGDGGATFAGNITAPTIEIASTSIYQAKIKSTGAQYLLIGSTDAGSAGIVLDGDSNGDGSGGDYSYIIHETSGVLKIQQDSPSGTNELHLGTAGTESRMVIDSSGNSTFAGNVTTGGKLEVTHDTNFVGKFTNTATSMSNNNYALMVDSSAHTSNMSTAGAMSVDVNSGRAFTINGIGRVSIGGNSQTANTLTLTGTATEMDINNTSTNGRSYRLESDSAGLFVIKDRTANADRIVLNSSGNVGIGTTSPTNILHVHQSDASSNSYLHITHQDGGSAATDGISIGLESDGINAAIRNRENGYLRMFTNNTERMRIDSSGDLTMQGGRIYVKESDLGNTAIALTRDADEGYVQLFSSGTQTIEIRGNGNSYFNSGNIGIGTTAPAYKLEVAGTIGTQDRLAIQQTYFGYSSAYKVVQYGETGSTKAISLGYNPSSNTNGGFTGNEILIPNNIRILAPNAADNQFYGVMMFDDDDKLLIGSSNYLIDSNYIMAMDPATKNVGIGTTSPGTKLSLEDSTTNGAVQISFKNDAREWRTGVHGGINDSFTLYDNTASATRLVVDSSGNVGIATTSPSQLLHCNGNALIHKLGVNAFNASFDFYNNGTTYLNGATTIDADLTISETNGEINFSSGNGYVQTTTGSTSLVLGTNSTEVLRCHSTGKVGINVTSPTEKLDVVDDGGNTNIRVYDSSGNSEVGLKLQNDAKTWTLQNWGSGGDNLRILNNAGNTIQLWDDNGNVGINNTSTSYKLDVTGQIRATDDIIAFSDIRVKENVKTLENSLSKVNNLRGVEFNKIGNNNKSIGVIAQEIEKILPEVVHTDNEGMKSVAYGNITGLLIEAVKELSKEVQELKKQIK